MDALIADLFAYTRLDRAPIALEFAPSGVKPQVRMRAERDEQWVRLRVEDAGIGIAPEHRERIFGVFERLHGVESNPGTGMGLAIVKKRAQRMGGEVGLESGLRKGSRFWVRMRGA